ncbi:unnamed protein product [Cuscuta europaea]|uniref:Cyclin n=1 Tax=Cuscuta europaea TaxID=41803 RepID=A0A9P1ECK8_CUSEU|nr:unnamed protein product [Cuscuta europaea]
MAMALTAETSPSSIIISPRKLRDDLHYPYKQTATAAAAATAATPLVISVLASVIERRVARNERIAKRYRGGEGGGGIRVMSASRVFECHETPNMSVQSYLERVFRYIGAGPSVFVVAYVYIDRLCLLHPRFRISPTNVHRLLITTILLASKYVEDRNYKNSYFARVGGLTRMEMNRLEVELLFMMGFKLHVNVSVFQSYCCHLEREVSHGGGYQIERTLRCAQHIKPAKQTQEDHTHFVTTHLL